MTALCKHKDSINTTQYYYLLKIFVQTGSYMLQPLNVKGRISVRNYVRNDMYNECGMACERTEPFWEIMQFFFKL